MARRFLARGAALKILMVTILLKKNRAKIPSFFPISAVMYGGNHSLRFVYFGRGLHFYYRCSRDPYFTVETQWKIDFSRSVTTTRRRGGVRTRGGSFFYTRPVRRAMVKVVLLGDTAVGKSCLCVRCVECANERPFLSVPLRKKNSREAGAQGFYASLLLRSVPF